MSYRESRNAASFARAQRAYDNMEPPEYYEDPIPDCPECGAEMEWDKKKDDWVCGCEEEQEESEDPVRDGWVGKDGRP